MYCYKCGKEMDKDEKTCKYCGAKTVIELERRIQDIEERLDELEGKQKIQRAINFWSLTK